MVYTETAIAESPREVGEARCPGAESGHEKRGLRGLFQGTSTRTYCWFWGCSGVGAGVCGVAGVSLDHAGGWARQGSSRALGWVPVAGAAGAAALSSSFLSQAARPRLAASSRARVTVFFSSFSLHVRLSRCSPLNICAGVKFHTSTISIVMSKTPAAGALAAGYDSPSRKLPARSPSCRENPLLERARRFPSALRHC